MAEEPLTPENLRDAIDGLSDDEIDRVGAEQGITNLVSRALAGTAARSAADTGEDGCLQWEIETPDGPAVWRLMVSDGVSEAMSGRDPSPRVVLSASLAEFLRVTAGIADLRDALLHERVRVAGDLVFAARLYAF